MNKSFYQYLLKYRDPEPKDAASRFANHVFEDVAFPKSSVDYHEISTYLELNSSYMESMSVFDRVWEWYMETESK